MDIIKNGSKFGNGHSNNSNYTKKQKLAGA